MDKEQLEQNPAQQIKLELEQKAAGRQLRREGNVQGGALMLYKAIMNIVVLLVTMVAAIPRILVTFLSGGFAEPSDYYLNMEPIQEAIESATGWGYLTAVAAGMGLLVIWKKMDFIRHEIFRPGKAMTVGTFFALLCLVFGLQVPTQLWAMGLEWICNRWDLSLLQVLEQNAMNQDHIGMWLYVCIAAPVFEEVVFRGLVLRSLQPYGKRFAITVSAILFGLFHGSPIQTPYAILVGFVLGFVAAEYNVIWAMVLHMMNNLLLSDVLPRVLSHLPEQLPDAVLWSILILCALAALIVLMLRWRDIRQWHREEQVKAWQRKALWLSPCIVILSLWCLLDLSAYFLLMFL